MPTMIYHAPFPLNRQAKAASGIRPVRMHDAFVEAGYEVINITGNGKQRRAAIRSLKQRLKEGLIVDFLYSESATIPTMLTESNHFPLHPRLDLALFRACHEYKIPTSLFYRDVYWAFDSYEETVGSWVARVMRAIYRYDLRWYNKYVSRLYLPSLQMGEEVPIYERVRMAALPPGCTAVDIEKRPSNYDLNLLYIGGLGGHYKLHELVKAVAELPSIRLTICTHPNQWESVKEEYAGLMRDNIRVVHESGEGLIPLYEEADVACLYVQPDEYRTFASPVKLYEYLGYSKPVLSSEGTHASRFISENECGWVIPYDKGSAFELLTALLSDYAAVSTTAERVKTVRESHTWLARARFVAQDLGALR